MTKTIALILALVLALGCFACKSQQEQTEEPVSATDMQSKLIAAYEANGEGLTAFAKELQGGAHSGETLLIMDDTLYTVQDSDGTALYVQYRTGTLFNLFEACKDDIWMENVRITVDNYYDTFDHDVVALYAVYSLEDGSEEYCLALYDEGAFPDNGVCVDWYFEINPIE